MNQKGSAALPIILIVLVVVVVGGYFLLTADKKGASNEVPFTTKESIETIPPITSESDQTSADITAEWKTYRNEQYGFEFKYPPAWPNTIYYGDNTMPFETTLGSGSDQATSITTGAFTVKVSSGGYYTRAGIGGLTFDQVLGFYPATTTTKNGVVIRREESFILDGVESAKFIVSDALSDSFEIFVKSSSEPFITISYVAYNLDNIPNQSDKTIASRYNELYEGIISSFKFIR